MQKIIQNQAIQPYDDEIDLRELFSVLWSSRLLILLISLTFTSVSLVYALITPNQYQATTLLAPAQQNTGSISSALSQFGGLASLAGISLGDGQDEDTRIALEVMQSRSFIEQFIKQSGIVVEIMAAKSWDIDAKRLVIDKNIFDTQTRRWTRTPPPGREANPSSWEAYKVFSEDMLSVSEDKKTGLVTLSIEYFSPYMAKQWVENYILAINLYLQERKLERIEKNIKYLKEQITTTSVVEMREIFFTLIEEQIKSKMLVEASPEYAFTVVGEVMLPEEKSQPKRALIVVLGMLLGAILSICLVLLRYYWFNNNAQINNS
ncbi:MAG: Wzz/FepE/Etk N-terminal domain-containing protein [Porticoccaceae bacterium]|nr:Wzz/FepE/Etk N-terminal domain-containing protein [Porticoccaceae bacterium]